MDAAQRTTTDALLERNQTYVSAMLEHFQNIIALAAMPEGEGTKELAAAQAFQMKVETLSLIGAAEDLLQLSRELKELWLFGPLRKLGEGDQNPKLDQDADSVEEFVNHLLKEVNRLSSGDVKVTMEGGENRQV